MRVNVINLEFSIIKKININKNPHGHGCRPTHDMSDIYMMGLVAYYKFINFTSFNLFFNIQKKHISTAH